MEKVEIKTLIIIIKMMILKAILRKTPIDPKIPLDFVAKLT
jgi:hypothetical protein